MIPAKDTATRILASAGVRVSWEKGGPQSRTTGCGSGGALQIIDIRFTYFTPAFYKPGALAEALPFALSGVRIMVFFDRVPNIFKGYPQWAGPIVGHVLAHEIGHVLLKINGHAQTGLMKARLTYRDLDGIGRKNMEFTSDDARLIRKNLASACPVIADFGSLPPSPVNRQQQIHDHLPDRPQQREPRNPDQIDDQRQAFVDELRRPDLAH
jgi:hypothetical protein